MGIIIQDDEVCLENQWMRRVIGTKDGIVTKSYHLRPCGKKSGNVWYPVFSFEESAPFEASVTVDGVYYEAAPFKRSAGANLWNREGAFRIKDIRKQEGRFGEAVDLIMENHLPGMPAMELNILYEICETHPFLHKKVKLVNRADKPITVDGMTVDMVRFFDRKLPLSVFSDCYCEVRSEDEYYFGWTRIAFPDEMGIVLEPGEALESFELYEAATAVDRQNESVILHRIYKKIAPWIKQLFPSLTVNSCSSVKELQEVADEARANGFELIHLFAAQLFTNVGDYVPRPDLFPNGYSDMKALVDYYHDRGLKVLPYCSATIAWRGTEVCRNHPDWQCLGPEGLRYDPAGLGNMCYHSPWGDYIREKLFYLIDEIGFDGLALDGPVHGLVCEDTNHRHKNARCVNFMNWQWEKRFYGEVASRGKILTAPECWNALLLGITEMPGGYREEDQNEMGGLPLVTMTRACVYETRYLIPACCVWTSFNLEDYHGHSIEASEENPASYEHAVAGMYGYGIDGTIYAQKPYLGEKTKAIYFKWLNILKQYRETFLGEFIHIAQPDGCAPDAVLHVGDEAEVPGLLVVFNPVGERMDFTAALPMRYAGLPGGSTVLVEGKELVLDRNSNVGVYTVLEPYEVKAIPIERG